MSWAKEAFPRTKLFSVKGQVGGREGRGRGAGPDKGDIYFLPRMSSTKRYSDIYRFSLDYKSSRSGEGVVGSERKRQGNSGKGEERGRREGKGMEKTER